MTKSPKRAAWSDAVPVAPQPTSNHGPRPEGAVVDMLVLHYTGMKSLDDALERMRDPDWSVSAHYVVDENGAVLGMVEETRRAWHAGVSSWRGETDVNSRSIGIELVNPGHEFGYRPFPEAQMASLVPLCRDILARHPIPARNVVGHSDVAPARKRDPGELFDWKRLAGEGIGLWPEPGDGGGKLSEILAEIGYDVSDEAAAVRAFQRRYRPGNLDGVPDDETLALASGLTAALGALP